MIDYAQIPPWIVLLCLGVQVAAIVWAVVEIVRAIRATR